MAMLRWENQVPEKQNDQSETWLHVHDVLRKMGRKRSNIACVVFPVPLKEV